MKSSHCQDFFQIARSDNPLCYHWNATNGEWVMSGVETVAVRLLQGGEFKLFNVECSTQLGSAAIAVIIEQETEVELIAVNLCKMRQKCSVF